MSALPERDVLAIMAAPPRLRAPLLRCARDEVPPNVALMQIAMAADSAAQVAKGLSAAQAALEEDGLIEAARRIGRALDLWHRMPGAFATVAGIFGTVDHTAAATSGGDAVRYWSSAFDQAAAVSPEGSVALFSLGDPDLLDAITDEIAARMADWDLLGSNRTLLDIGCGIGRIAQRLSPHARFVAGIDISPRMLAVARRRCAGFGNIGFLRSSGRDLAIFSDACFDTVYAIDAFPYLAQANGLAAAHFQDSARVLKPGGRFLLFNYSYGDAIEAQRTVVARMAAAGGLVVLRSGTRDLALWDGWTFLMQRR